MGSSCAGSTVEPWIRGRAPYYVCSSQSMKKDGSSCTSISNTSKDFGGLERKEIFRNSHDSLCSFTVWIRNGRNKKLIHSKLNEDSFFEPLYYLLQTQNSVIRRQVELFSESLAFPWKSVMQLPDCLWNSHPQISTRHMLHDRNGSPHLCEGHLPEYIVAFIMKAIKRKT